MCLSNVQDRPATPSSKRSLKPRLLRTKRSALVAGKLLLAAVGGGTALLAMKAARVGGRAARS
jgi:hypothetical protein